ncbi:DUF4355 domain-containing protein [Staphylococcus saprophyticus]|uniref:DUF4355 domain-containing protein n=2 Tax=Staphylococcus TaxID=1279 RepID=UPI0022EADF3A|nr:DUF4355 domain-containing protein [Staphylococcus saprophyticus]
MEEQNNDNVIEEQDEQQTDEQNDSKDEQSNSDEKTFTQKELDEIVKERVAREKKQAEKKAKEAADEAERLAKMNKDQKAEYEREKMQKELDYYKEKEAHDKMKKEAASMFKEQDINAPDELLDIVTSKTAEETQENVQAFTKILNDVVHEQVQAKLNNGTPKNYGSSSNGVTRESIMSIKDDSQRQRAIAQNRHLFD